MWELIAFNLPSKLLVIGAVLQALAFAMWYHGEHGDFFEGVSAFIGLVNMVIIACVLGVFGATGKMITGLVYIILMAMWMCWMTLLYIAVGKVSGPRHKSQGCTRLMAVAFSGIPVYFFTNWLASLL